MRGHHDALAARGATLAADKAPGTVAGMKARRWLAALGALASMALAACGGGGGGGDAGTAPPSGPSSFALPAADTGSGTFVRVVSAAGDTVGVGLSRTYNLSNAGVQVTVSNATIRVQVRGDEYWEGYFRTSSRGDTEVRVGEGLLTGLRASAARAVQGVGFEWQREDTRCTDADGILSVDRVRYDNGQLVEFDLRFVQRCDGATGALQVQIRWSAAESPVRAAAPAVPADLWRPAAGAVPASGNVIHIEATGVEPVFNGRTETFTEDNALLEVSAAGDRIDITVRGRRDWFARLRGIQRPEGFQVGFYDGLRGFDARYNPARGATEWYGAGRCSNPRGWLAVDQLELSRGALVAVELRFEQRCLDAPGILRGVVRWRAAERRLPPPHGPTPAGLWEPAEGTTPATGNYLHLAGDYPRWTGPTGVRLLTPDATDFKVYDDLGTLRMVFTERASGIEWRGDFFSRVTATRVERGYREITRGPSFNRVTGNFRFSGNDIGCAIGSGWYSIDDIAHRHGVLRSITVRFELRCSDIPNVLRGKLRWTSPDPAITKGPADPAPLEPVLAPEPTMPSTGSAFLFESRGLHPLGGNRTWLYTTADSFLWAGPAFTGPSFGFTARGDESWSGEIWPPASLTRLTPGRHAFENGMGRQSGEYRFSLSGVGPACDIETGWFEVDRADYDGDRLVRLDMRFEHRCKDAPYPLFGTIRWLASDVAAPLPPQPIPAGLWAPPVSALPASGGYVLLQSNMGGFVGGGVTTMEPQSGNAVLKFEDPGLLRLWFSSTTQSSINLNLTAPRGVGRFQRGFYELLETANGDNPLRLAAKFSANSRTCNEMSGWLAIDEIEYDAVGLVRIALRMSQVCDGTGPPAFLAMRWER